MIRTPTRININDIRQSKSPKKPGRPISSTILGLPVSSKSSQVPPYAIVAEHLKLPEAKFVESRNKSIASKSRMVSSATSSMKSEKLRQLMMKRIDEISKNLKSKINYPEHLDVTKMINSLTEITSLDEFLDTYLKCYDLCSRLATPPEEEEDDMRLQINVKEKKRLLFIDESIRKDDRYSKKKSIRNLERDNQNLKKDLFKCREFIKSLEKRILSLVDEYQERKRTYMTEIEKLTKILNTTLVNIPEILLKGKEKELMERKSPPQRKKTETTNLNSNSSKGNEYNIRAMQTDFLDAFSISHQANYKLINTPQIVKKETDAIITPMQRYRSLSNLKKI